MSSIDGICILLPGLANESTRFPRLLAGICGGARDVRAAEAEPLDE